MPAYSVCTVYDAGALGAAASNALTRRVSLVCQHGLRLGFCADAACVEVVSATITGVSKRADGVFEFCLAVSLRPSMKSKGGEWRCSDLNLFHRYKAFHRLNKRLVERYGADIDIPHFPGKKFNQLISADRVAQSRQAKLNRYLDGIMEHERLRNCEDFKCFTSPDDQARSLFYRSQER